MRTCSAPKNEHFAWLWTINLRLPDLVRISFFLSPRITKIGCAFTFIATTAKPFEHDTWFRSNYSTHTANKPESRVHSRIGAPERTEPSLWNHKNKILILISACKFHQVFLAHFFQENVISSFFRVVKFNSQGDPRTRQEEHNQLRLTLIILDKPPGNGDMFPIGLARSLLSCKSILDSVLQGTFNGHSNKLVTCLLGPEIQGTGLGGNSSKKEKNIQQTCKYVEDPRNQAQDFWFVERKEKKRKFNRLSNSKRTREFKTLVFKKNCRRKKICRVYAKFFFPANSPEVTIN